MGRVAGGSHNDRTVCPSLLLHSLGSLSVLQLPCPLHPLPDCSPVTLPSAYLGTRAALAVRAALAHLYIRRAREGRPISHTPFVKTPS